MQSEWQRVCSSRTVSLNPKPCRHVFLGKIMTTYSGDSRRLGLLSFGTGQLDDAESSGLFGGFRGVAGFRLCEVLAAFCSGFKVSNRALARFWALQSLISRLLFRQLVP